MTDGPSLRQGLRIGRSGEHWPVVLRGSSPAGDLVTVRPIAKEDERSYRRVRRDSREWLAPWEATSPVRPGPPTPFGAFVRAQHAEAEEGRSLPFVFTVGRRGVSAPLAGQLTVSNIVEGASWSCAIGYWIGQGYAGRWITPTAVALVGDHLFRDRRMHRIEINIRPENAASLAVVRKLGFREEGPRPAFLHIAGAWRDHLSFALTTEDLAGGSLMDRLSRAYQESHPRHTG